MQLGDLALVAHVSGSYLSTKFKKETGCSFTEYLIRFRMNKAQEIMKASPWMNCREVAESVGYDDYTQFSKMFRKQTGMTPTECREKSREEKANGISDS